MNRYVGAILLLIIQIVILNHLDFSAYIYPQMFIMILINLPPYLNKSLQVVIGFGLGLLVDLFLMTPGIHASACMSLILVRIFVLNRMDIDEIIANRATINVKSLPTNRYIWLASVFVLFYHLVAFGIERVGAINWIEYAITVVISSALTMLLILFAQFLFYRKLSV